jgi:hypothetical protein
VPHQLVIKANVKVAIIMPDQEIANIVMDNLVRLIPIVQLEHVIMEYVQVVITTKMVNIVMERHVHKTQTVYQ